jgi:drug/metabolite transporter (DMT)-like permease
MTPPTPASSKRALLYCLLANVLGGSTFVAMDRAHASGLPTVTFSFVRTAISTLLFVVLAAVSGELRPRFDRRDWTLVLLVAIPGFALPLVLGIRGVALSTPGVGSILALMEPIAIVPLSWLFLHERLPRARVVAIGVGLLGALLVVAGDAATRGAADGGRLTGNVLLAVQGSMWAVYTVAAKPLTSRHSPTSVSLWSTAVGCAALGLVAPLEWDGLRPRALDGVAAALHLPEGVGVSASGASSPGAIAAAFGAALPWMLYLALFASFLAVWLWNAGLEGVPATAMAIFIFVQPAVGLALHFASGREAPTVASWAGLALIAVAVAQVTRERPAAVAAPPTDPPPRAR